MVGKKTNKVLPIGKTTIEVAHCKKDTLSHKHLIHINKSGQMTQIPLKHTLTPPHKTHYSISTPPSAISNLLRAFDSFLTNLLICINCL